MRVASAFFKKTHKLAYALARLGSFIIISSSLSVVSNIYELHAEATFAIKSLGMYSARGPLHTIAYLTEQLVYTVQVAHAIFCIRLLSAARQDTPLSGMLQDVLSRSCRRISRVQHMLVPGFLGMRLNFFQYQKETFSVTKKIRINNFLLEI